MMIAMRSGTPDHPTMTELRCACAPLACMTRSLLPVRLFIPTRYFGTSLGRSITLTTIHQLCGDHLMQNRHMGGNSEYLFAQFELIYGLSGHVIHCSRG